MINISSIAVYIGVITFFSQYKFLQISIERQGHPLLSSMVPFFSLVILIGGSIVITLSYVSWRKYKGTEYQKKMQKRKPND